LSSTAFTCICDTGYILYNKQCLLCPTVNGNGTTKSSTVCNCDPGYIFNITSNIPACICDIKTGFVISDTGDCFYCLIDYSLGSPLGQTCKCAVNFVWNWDINTHTGTCDCPSPKIINATKACVCPTTSITLTTTSSCFDCLLVSNGAGKLNPTNKSACSCNIPYVFVWNASSISGVCSCNSTSITNSDGSCFNCATVTNSTGKPDTINSSNCGCKSPFIWNN